MLLKCFVSARLRTSLGYGRKGNDPESHLICVTNYFTTERFAEKAENLLNRIFQSLRAAWN